MNAKQIEKTNRERFNNWYRHFISQNATVQVMLGVSLKGPNKNSLIITSTKGMHNVTIKHLLQTAIDEIERQEEVKNQQ